MDFLTILTTAGMAIFFFLLVLLIIAIIYYILRSKALYDLLKALNYQNAWLAWFPVLHRYAVGDVATSICSEDGYLFLFGSIALPDLLCKLWFLGNILISMLLGRFQTLSTLLTFSLTVFFSAGILSELVANLRGEETKQEIGMAVVASIIPFADVVYFKKVTNEIIGN